MSRYPTETGGSTSAGGGTTSSGGVPSSASSGGSSPGGSTSGGGALSTGGSTHPTCGSDFSVDAAASGDAGVPVQPKWDWVGVVGTGQSLSVGTLPIMSTKQPYGNLKLSLGDAQVPPWDAGIDTMTMVQLIEPIRPILGSGSVRPYPGNIWGETPHSAMANAITFLVQCAAPSRDYVTVHTVVGESGQGIVALQKDQGDAGTTGSTGRAYAATLFEVSAITHLAQKAGKSYGIGAIIMTHGETDSGSSTYKNDLIKLLADYNQDLAQITGQTERIPMYLSQQHGYPNGFQQRLSDAGTVYADYSSSKGQRPIANVVQWQLGVDHKDDFVCIGPQFQYETNPNPSSGDFSVHLSALGYQMLGEKNAQVYYERVVLGHDWQPLQPATVSRDGRNVIVNFHVPVPPLNRDESFRSSGDC